MKRLMPFRDYDEHDVVNMFALNTSNTKINDSGNGDSGVIVKVTNGTIVSEEAVSLSSATYMGKVDYPYAGRNYYPSVSLTVGAAGTGDLPLGITLNETAMYDENDEKIIYYKEKGRENQVVVSGQAVPVATAGLFTLTDGAFVGAIPAPGSKLVIGSGSGKFAAYGASGAGSTVYGQVLATGQRVAGPTADYFAGAAGSTGTYALVRVSF